MAVTDDDLFSDAIDTAVSDSALGKISAHAKRMIELNREVARHESVIKTLKEEFRDIEQRKLPEAMLEAGVSEFKLDNGAKITVRDTVHGSIPEENRAAAFKWLRDNDFGDIIKNEIKVPFGKGEDEKAKAVQDYLKEKYGLQTEAKESVHASTLAAWAKEQLKKGVDVPLDTLGLWAGRKAVVKL